jgi:hypothetical protein
MPYGTGRRSSISARCSRPQSKLFTWHTVAAAAAAAAVVVVAVVVVKVVVVVAVRLGFPDDFLTHQIHS